MRPKEHIKSLLPFRKIYLKMLNCDKTCGKKKTTTIMISDSTPIDRSLSKQLVLMLPYIAAESDIELASAYIIVWAMIKVYEWVLRNCDRWSRFISVIILNLSRFYRPYWRHLPSILTPLNFQRGADTEEWRDLLFIHHLRRDNPKSNLVAYWWLGEIYFGHFKRWKCFWV